MATTLAPKGLIAVSDKIVLAAQPYLELVKLFVNDFTPSPAKKYETVDINVVYGAVDQFAKGTNNYTTGTMGEVNFAKLQLDRDSLAHWSFGDMKFLEDEFHPDWSRLGPSAGQNLGKDFVQNAVSKLVYTAKDSAHTFAAVASATFADYVELWNVANAAGYNPDTCVLILEPNAYLKLKTLAEYKVTGVPLVQQAQALGAILGFKAVIVSPNCPKASGASENKAIGYIVPENALGFVNRIKSAAKSGGNLLEEGTTTDEATGISIGMRVVANTDDGEYVWNAECLYGTGLLKQNVTVDGASRANKAPGFVQIVTP